MAKDKITEYDSTANNNTVCGDVNIAENSALPSDMNNFAREIMSHLKEGLGSGTPLYVDQTNNRVGINKTPTVALDVSGSLSVDGGTIKLDGNYPVGTQNTALGDGALSSGSLSGGFNVAIGNNALSSNTSGGANIGIGSSALSSNTTASKNIGIGESNLASTTTGGSNVSVGDDAMYANTTGSNNVAIGNQALVSNTEASNNTAVGYEALYANTTGGDNTAIGAGSLDTNTTGNDNVAVGRLALESNTTADDNVAMGFIAMRYNTTGANNTAIGSRSLSANTTASNNTAVGYQAGDAVTNGFENTFLGSGAGTAVTTGDRNLFAGNNAGELATTGNNNTFVGANGTAGSCGGAMTTGSKNTILGGYTGNQGGLDIRTSNNNIVLSDGDGNPRFYINASGHLFAPALGSASSANSDVRYSTANGSIYYQTSSQRYKENIVDLEFDTSNLYNLRPVSYDDKATGERCFGLIAEETFAQIPELVVTRDIDGETLPDSIPYSMLTVAIINEMKKLKEKNDALEARIATLEGE